MSAAPLAAAAGADPIPRRGALRSLAGLAMLAAGCASQRRPDAARAGSEPAWRPCGEVLRARPDRGWVVLECPVEPTPDAVMALWRDGRPAARVRATARRRAGHVIAEIVDGDPRPGDRLGPAP